MFTHFCARSARRRATRPTRTRLWLRCLEERIVPATLIVTDPGDNGGSNQLRAIWDTARFNAEADTITFAPSVTTVALTSALGFYSESADLTITGNGKNVTTIQAPPSSRIFDFLGFSLTSKVTITDMSFQGGNVGGSNGGAIHSASTPLFLTNVKFADNRASSGGAVGIDGENTSLTVTGCEFSSNTATVITDGNYGGGGIYVFTYSSVSVTINNSTFDSNRSGTGGSAFSSWGKIVLQSDSCTFSNGRSLGFFTGPGCGGAIVIPGDSTININHAAVFGNSTADSGGMISVARCQGTIQNSTIFSNTAARHGGAIMSGVWTLINNKFTDNLAGSSGGAIGNAAMDIVDCIFDHNRASWHGGAIYTSGASSSITRSIFRNNSAALTGGAVNLGNATMTLSVCDFDANTAGGDGGAISGGGPITLTSCTLHGNTSGSSGGALGGVKATVNQCTFTKNTAAGTAGGGAIWAGNLTINNSTIYDNTASSDSASVGGGGILRTSRTATVTIRSSIIAGNKLGGSSTHGSDFYNATTTFTLAGNNNFFGTTVGMGVTLTGAYLGGDNANPLDPLLAPLADNGGPVLPDGSILKTMALQFGSPAINAGNNSAAFTHDQRGAPYARTYGSATDIGATEFPAPPVVSSVVFGDGTNQRSTVRQIVVTFSEAVTFTPSVASAFTLRRVGSSGINGNPIGDVTLIATPVVGPTNSVTITFSGALTESGGSLIDGLYDFTISAAQVSGANGLLDGNNDLIPGGSYTVTGSTTNRFYRLFGDSDGSGVVNQSDFNALRLAYLNGPSTIFDFDNDGEVAQLDYNAFRTRFLSGP